MTDMIDAGGVGPLGPDGRPPADAPHADVLTVRVYRHPGLGDGDPDRPVVRLVAGQLGEAEDLTMEFLGFSAPERTEPVGSTGRQALGFPAWALVHDPANGRHALAIVKDMRRIAARAVGKPGFAMDDYLKLATTLGGAAPQFLPTFWEEAGRAFLAAENVKYAATCFNRAREAEQVHALEIDEDRVAEVFLEFAQAGAVPVKSVSQYARDLAARSKPEAAFDRFRAVTLRRVGSGLPPYAALPGEIRRLASAAGRNGDDAVADVVADLLGLAATAKSAPGTWKALQPGLARAAKSRPRVRGRLLDMLPDQMDAVSWIELLVAVGADAGLVDEVDPAAAPTDGPAGWLERFTRRHHQGAPQLVALVERMLPRLRAAGRPVTVGDGHHGDLDLVDLCLAEGVAVDWRGPVAPDVHRWLTDRAGGGRDLAAMAADERFRMPLADAAVGSLRSRPDGLAAVVATSGLRDAVADWLRRVADTWPTDPTALNLARHVGRVGWVGTPAAAALQPDAVRRIAAADVAPALTRTLRCGLLAEYGWPDFDAAVDSLGDEISFGPSWPYLVVQDKTTAVVLGPAGVLLRHPFSTESRDWYDRSTAWVPGVDRLAVWSWNAGYWADAPGEKLSGSWTGIKGATPLPLPGGAVSYGGVPWEPGDESFPEVFPVASDGTGHWTLRTVDGERRWLLYDPATGRLTGDLPPARFAGPDVVANGCRLLPAPAEWAGSPLGVVDGLLGQRVVRRADDTIVLTRIDGREVEVPATVRKIAGALTFPGSDDLCPVGARDQSRANGSVMVFAPDGQPLADESCGPDLPPALWLHAGRVRDPDGSAVLRTIDPAVVGALLDATVAAVDARQQRDLVGKERWEADRALEATVRSTVAAVLPGITDERLRAAVARHARAAADVVRDLRRLAALPDAEPADAGGPAPVARTFDRAALNAVARRHGQYTWINDDDMANAERQLQLLPAVLAGSVGPDGWPDSDLDWPALLAAQGPLAVTATAAGSSAAERTTAAALLDLVRRTGFAAADGTVRALRLAAGEEETFRPPHVVRTGDRTLLVVAVAGYGQYHTAVDHDPTGTFGPVDGATINSDRRADWGGPAALDTLLSRLADDGPPPWRPELVADLVARTGMSPSTATLLLAGMPNVDSNDANFLDKTVRTTLGLSVAEANAGRSNLRAVDETARQGLLAAMLPADPAQLWTTGPDVARLAGRWLELVGRRVQIPDDVLADARKLGGYQDLSQVLVELAGEPDWLEPGGGTVDRNLGRHGPALLWLAYRLPLDSPLRPEVARWYDRIRAFVTDPATSVHVGQVDAGTALPPSVTAEETAWGPLSCTVHPARITGPDDPVFDLFTARALTTVRPVLDPRVAGLMDALREPSGRTGYAQDPAVEVPDLVAEVAARHGLGADAARYYLQLLTLGDPTDRNVQRWTGWTAATLKKVRAELAGSGLVVEAKRAGAGRSVFLPGGWDEEIDVETWKSGHLGTPGVLGTAAPSRPVADLFRAAWRRIVDGDVPRLRDLGTAR